MLLSSVFGNAPPPATIASDADAGVPSDTPCVNELLSGCVSGYAGGDLPVCVQREALVWPVGSIWTVSPTSVAGFGFTLSGFNSQSLLLSADTMSCNLRLC